LNDLGVIDRILKEPVGGAHRERDLIIDQVGDAVIEELDDLSQLSSDELRRDRRQKFLDMGRQGLA
jgi:acetyl-CoA carboxylase carboxyl transferase subunit alpha